MSIEEVKKFIIDGSYAKLKHEEEKLKLLKNLIRNEQDRLNNKRMLWRKHGVIGEFVTNKLYEYDRMELNEFLYNLGILPIISNIDSDLLTIEELQIIKPFQTKGEKYIRFTPNKVGKTAGINPVTFYENINEMPLANIVALWKRTFLETEFLRKAWKSKRKLAAGASFNSVSFELGTITLLEKPGRYKSNTVFDLLTKETLLKCSVVDLQRIVEFTAKGFLKMSELNKIRKITDIQRKYFLMTLEKEQSKRMYWKSKLEEISKLSL